MGEFGGRVREDPLALLTMRVTGKHRFPKKIDG
jgi:hypothetical protein